MENLYLESHWNCKMNSLGEFTYCEKSTTDPGIKRHFLEIIRMYIVLKCVRDFRLENILGCKVYSKVLLFTLSYAFTIRLANEKFIPPWCNGMLHLISRSLDIGHIWIHTWMAYFSPLDLRLASFSHTKTVDIHRIGEKV